MARYVVSGQVQIGIWAMRGGAWTRVAGDTVQIYEDVNNQGWFTVNWIHRASYQLGLDVTDIGVTIEQASGTSSLQYLQVTYTNQASGAERSATANGGSATAIVRP